MYPSYDRLRGVRVMTRNEYMRKWRAAHRAEETEKKRAYTKRVFAAVLAQYGSECACCGEDEPRFLTVDHVDGSGAQHRREIKRFGREFYVWLRLSGWPSGYRILCWNCNSGRFMNGGVCPHEV